MTEVSVKDEHRERQLADRKSVKLRMLAAPTGILVSGMLPFGMLPFGTLLIGLIVLASGCAGSQSTFRDAGTEAQKISQLFYWMVGGAVIIWSLVTGLLLFALKTKRTFDPHSMRRIIIGGGALFPTIVLTVLLSYGLSMMPDLQQPAPEGSLTIRVSGVRWWWRVAYIDATADSVELASEIVLPVGEPIEFKLTAEDVIHSFWIPALGGKMDMVPGRENRLKLRPIEVGTFRGVCAEYCGEAHAQMSFIVKVVERHEFESWLANQRMVASVTTENARAGLELFLARGCGACHAVRGTDARGQVGPDLTHFGSRETIAAGWLPNELDEVHRWIRETKSIKPGVEMPQFDILSERDSLLIAEFLEGLK